MLIYPLFFSTVSVTVGGLPSSERGTVVKKRVFTKWVTFIGYSL
jgi:hypothetical protein